MKRLLICSCIFVVLGYVSGCAMFQTREPEPPPLPSIETKSKPPLTLKGAYFKEFPWSELGEPRKDEVERDTKIYSAEGGETFDRIAEDQMGNRAMGSKLAEYNGLSPNAAPSKGDRIVIPNPIIGVSSQLLIKHKGEKEFGPPVSFDTELKKGDEFKMKFSSNVDGFLYVLRQTKAIEFLYPPKAKPAKRAKNAPAVEPPTVKVNAYDPVEIPVGKKGFVFDLKNRGETVYVFLSMKEIPELEKLKNSKSISEQDMVEVMHRVNQANITSEPPYNLLRVSEPDKILGFKLDIRG